MTTVKNGNPVVTGIKFLWKIANTCGTLSFINDVSGSAIGDKPSDIAAVAEYVKIDEACSLKKIMPHENLYS